MGLLQKLNIMTKNQILMNYIGELKKDKELLEQENLMLKEKLFNFYEKSSLNPINEPISPMKLTPKELNIYNYTESNPAFIKKDIAREFKLSDVSVGIYLSRIRKKGYTINK